MVPKTNALSIRPQDHMSIAWSCRFAKCQHDSSEAVLDDYTWRKNTHSCSTAKIHGYSFTMAQQGLGIKLLDLCPACDQQLATTFGGVCQGPSHKLQQTWTHTRETHADLHEVSASKRSTWVDPGRTRACNLWFRRPTPYPLGHRTTCT